MLNNLFLLLRTLVITDFLTSDAFSNRQYLIFGILAMAGLVISILSVVRYHAKQG